MKTTIALLVSSMLALSPSLPALAQVSPTGLEHLSLERDQFRENWRIPAQDTMSGLEPMALQPAAYPANPHAGEVDPLTGFLMLGMGLGLAGTQAVIDSWRAPGPRDPALALGLSAGSAASMVGLSYLWRSMGPLSFVGGLAPLGLSVGYVYAGEPERGGAVALGTYGVLVGASVVSWLAYEIVVPRHRWKNSMTDPVSWGIGTGMALTGLYVLWSLVDVYQVAERRR